MSSAHVHDQIEFECNDCGQFFFLYIHKEYRNKNVRIGCPDEKCGRVHPRFLTDRAKVEATAAARVYKSGEGKLLTRNWKESEGDLFIGLKSTLSKTSRMDKKNFSSNKRDRGGFLAGLWCRKAANEDGREA